MNYISANYPRSLWTALCATVFALSAQSSFADTTIEFQPEPIGKVAESPYQLKIRFDDMMKKESAFKVTCNPEMPGFESWADNNRMWTYSFTARAESGSSQLPGGAACQVTQIKDLISTDGKTLKSGSINYKVEVAGPKVTGIVPVHGFNGFLRETDPVVFIRFNGDMDRELFFKEQNGYLHYLSANAPAEKIQLAPVPADQEMKLLKYFIDNGYFYGVNEKTRNWVIATIKQSLIPAAKVAIKIQNVRSGFNPNQRMEGVHSQEFLVRSQFLAEVKCQQLSATQATCLPKSPISVLFNGKVKWSDAKDTYIEYIPFNAKDGKTVRTYAELPPNPDESYTNRFINFVSQYIPALARFSGTLIEDIQFNVNIEPETQAQVSIPANLVDIDGRKLSNAITQFHLRIGSLKEILKIPGPVAVFEKNVPNVFLPVRVANLHQTLVIRKTGSSSDNSHWASIQDPVKIIELIKAYELRGTFRDSADYQSPMTQLGLSTVETQLKLEGEKNRHTMLQIPFSDTIKSGKSGLYALEISSPTLDQEHNQSSDSFINPRFVLAQVTDLAIHVKVGKNKNMLWITRYSDGLSAAGIQTEIYNCLGQKIASGTTDSSGLIEFSRNGLQAVCQSPESSAYSPYLNEGSFYAFARSGDEFSFTHSSWTSQNGSAYSSPGIEYSYSDLTENKAYFHSIIGVNLVKPGQKVPVEIIAKMPLSKGFASVPREQLPTKARITSDADSDLFYEFPLTWNAETSSFVWEVPAASTAQLGSYELTLLNAKNERVNSYSSMNSIEVAEFKIPLMTGAVSLPEKLLVKPETLPVNAFVKYANGVGAKDLGISLSYFFQDSSVYFEQFNGFNFANGTLPLTQDSSSPEAVKSLPSEERPSLIEGLKTNENGVLLYDIAKDQSLDGRTIQEALKEISTPKKLIVRAKYQDQMGEFQTLSQSKEIFNSDLYLGTNLVKGDRASAQLRAVMVNAEGKLSQAMGQMKLEVLRIETKMIGEELFGGLIKNTIQKELKPVRWNGGCKVEKGITTCAVTALKAGSYVFQAHAQSGIASSHTLFKVDKDGRVYGEHDYFHFGDEEDSKVLPLALNKKTFKGSEKAIVSFPAPFKTCSALVTVEKQDVISARVVEKACEKGSVELVTDSELAPNAFVSVYAVSGRVFGNAVNTTELDLGRPSYRIGFADLKVDWDLYETKVDVKTAKPIYEPRETVEVLVEAKASMGQLENATVTVLAIEEKILELKENKTYDILNSMMQMRGHEVYMVTPMKHIETVAVVENPEHDKSAGRKGGDEGGDGASGTELKRKLFDALVHFQQGVRLENGRAVVSFKANDSLAKFKVFAIVQSGNHKFGSGSVSYLSSQETQTFANIPPSVHSGDEFPVKLNLQNNSDKDQTYTAEVTVEILDQDGKVIGTKRLTKSVMVKKSSSDQADLGRLTVPDEASGIRYSIRIKDQSGKTVDLMEPDVQRIMPSVPLSVQDAFIEQMKSDKYSLKLEKSADALPGKGDITVSAAKSLVHGARMQIADRIEKDVFAKFFIESRFFAALLSGSKEQMTSVYTDLLSSMDGNGFVKYYPQAHRGSVWLTASILQVLQSETWALDVMPSALRKRFETAVSMVLTKSVNPDHYGKNEAMLLRAQILMGHAAFILGNQQLMDAAKSVSAEINQEINSSTSKFGAPMNKWSNDDLLDYWMFQIVADGASVNAQAAYKLLSTTRVVFSGNMAQLQGNPQQSWFGYTDETMESAKLLSGIALTKRDANLARALAAGLVNGSRNKWYVTSSLVWVAGALKKFNAAYESTPVTGNAMINLPESQKSAPVDWSKSSTGTVTGGWKDAKATVQVQNFGQGLPWISVQARQAIPLKGSRNQGIQVEKQIKNLTRSEGFKAGDLIEVTLTVKAAADIEHVGINDPIPGGSNIVGEAYGGYVSSSQKSYSGYKFYMSYLGRGASTVKYQYQLNNPGKFKMAPTRAEAIYMPSTFGETANLELIVQ